MPTNQSPPLLRRQLGAELRRLREGAQLAAADVAARLGWSDSKVSRIETASTSVRNADLQRLFEVYETPDAERSRILALAGQSRQRGWWEAYGDSLLGPYETYIGFESEAASIFTYDATVLNGLLQTVEYASAIVRTLSAGDRPEVINGRVSVRMGRQSVLTREPQPHLRSIIDEAVLRRPIGGKDVMRRQLMRLLEVGGQPTITVQILPIAVGAHRGLDGSFAVLEFPDGGGSPVVYCDGMTGGVFRNKQEEIRHYLMSFESLRTTALSHSDSMEFISSAIHWYE